MTAREQKLALCLGCRDDFYNGKNDLGVKECWNLKRAKVVKRFKQGWWTEGTSPSAFRRVETLDCHYAPGRYALKETLPPDIDASKVRS